MNINKQDLTNLFITTFVLWGFVMLISKVLYPQFIYFNGLVSAIVDRKFIVIFYLCGLIAFILLSYISFLLGLSVVYDKTIGIIIRSVKSLFNESHFQEDYYFESECYTSNDIIHIGMYTIVALPLMIYLVFPALFIGLLIILILYCVLHR